MADEDAPAVHSPIHDGLAAEIALIEAALARDEES